MKTEHNYKKKYLKVIKRQLIKKREREKYDFQVAFVDI